MMDDTFPKMAALNRAVNRGELIFWIHYVYCLKKHTQKYLANLGSVQVVLNWSWFDTGYLLLESRNKKWNLNLQDLILFLLI